MPSAPAFIYPSLQADNGVANPEDKLPIFVVGNFGCIHPESTDRYGTITGTEGIRRILIAGTHMESSLRDVHHSRRFREASNYFQAKFHELCPSLGKELPPLPLLPDPQLESIIMQTSANRGIIGFFSFFIYLEGIGQI